MRDEGGSSDDEADHIADHGDTDHKVEVKELWSCEERWPRIVLRTKKAGIFTHVRQHIVAGSKEVHTDSNTSDEKSQALGITNVDEQNLALVGASLHI